MRKQLIAIFLLIVYCTLLIKVMVFKDVPPLRVGHLMLNFGGTQTGKPNFLPFKSILPYLYGEKGFLISSINLIGNILLLVPLGFLLPLAFKRINWKTCLISAIAAGLTIEGLQVILQIGIFDIDDVILNGLGVMIGFWTYMVIAKLLQPFNDRQVAIGAIIIVVVVTLVVFRYVSIGSKIRLSVPLKQTLRVNETLPNKLGPR